MKRVLHPVVKMHYEKRSGTHHQEVHSSISGAYARSRAITQKILQTGYYWPSMSKHTNEFIVMCYDYQIHSNIPALPPTEMTSITSPWPLFQWAIDIMGPFL